MADVESTNSEQRQGLNRRQALGYAGAAVAGAVGSGILAAGPAGAATADVTTSDHGNGALEMRTINLHQAERIINAGIRFVEERDYPPMFLIVVDASGEEKASKRMDGNSPAATVLAPIKATTARAFRTPTIDLAARVTPAAAIASFTTAGYSLLGGGRPIVGRNDMVIGAIGVGGGSGEEDDEVAAAAIAAL